MRRAAVSVIHPSLRAPEKRQPCWFSDICPTHPPDPAASLLLFQRAGQARRSLGKRLGRVSGMVQRSDLSIDTLLGTQEITASYNGASGDWIWSFQM